LQLARKKTSAVENADSTRETSRKSWQASCFAEIRVPTHFQKPFSMLFNAFSILNEKILNPSFIFIFPNFYS